MVVNWSSSYGYSNPLDAEMRNAQLAAIGSPNLQAQFTSGYGARVSDTSTRGGISDWSRNPNTGGLMYRSGSNGVQPWNNTGYKIIKSGTGSGGGGMSLNPNIGGTSGGSTSGGSGYPSAGGGQTGYGGLNSNIQSLIAQQSALQDQANKTMEDNQRKLEGLTAGGIAGIQNNPEMQKLLNMAMQSAQTGGGIPEDWMNHMVNRRNTQMMADALGSRNKILTGAAGNNIRGTGREIALNADRAKYASAARNAGMDMRVLNELAKNQYRQSSMGLAGNLIGTQYGALQQARNQYGNALTSYNPQVAPLNGLDQLAQYQAMMGGLGGTNYNGAQSGGGTVGGGNQAGSTGGTAAQQAALMQQIIAAMMGGGNQTANTAPSLTWVGQQSKAPGIYDPLTGLPYGQPSTEISLYPWQEMMQGGSSGMFAG
jgi:hypothetical protein